MEFGIIFTAILVAAVGFVLILLSGRSQRVSQDAQRLAAIERKLDTIMNHLEIAEPPPTEDPDVLALLIRGQKIQAIKVYRDRTGAGLAEAKDAVEAIARARGLGL